MKFVLYLSGRSMPLRWHQTEDSVAASVTIPKGKEDAFVELLEECGALEDTPPRDWTILELDEGIDDMMSDIESNGIEDEFYEVAKAIREVIRDEASCGVFHLVKGNKA